MPKSNENDNDGIIFSCSVNSRSIGRIESMLTAANGAQHKKQQQLSMILVDWLCRSAVWVRNSERHYFLPLKFEHDFRLSQLIRARELLACECNRIQCNWLNSLGILIEYACGPAACAKKLLHFVVFTRPLCARASVTFNVCFFSSIYLLICFMRSNDFVKKSISLFIPLFYSFFMYISLFPLPSPSIFFCQW